MEHPEPSQPRSLNATDSQAGSQLFLLRAVRVGCFCVVILGSLLHVAIRDRFSWPLALLHYALPRPLLLVAALVGCAISGRGRFRRAMGGTALVLAGWVACCDFAWTDSAGSAPGSRAVVFWNVGHNLVDDVSIVDGFLAQQPETLGLVETGPLPEPWLAEWRARHPDYEFAIPNPGCLLAVRGRSLGSGYHRLGPNSHVGWIDAEVDGQSFRAVLVDIVANPWVSRKEPLGGLAELLGGWSERPLVVMGDFNTPDDSVWMASLHENFREAFRTAGRGYAPTWPWPAPILKLDQVWISRAVEVRRAWQTTTWRSDHRPQWAEIAWPEHQDDAQRPD